MSYTILFHNIETVTQEMICNKQQLRKFFLRFGFIAIIIAINYHSVEGKILRLPCSFYSDLSVVQKNSRLLAGILDTIQVEDDLDCIKQCILNDACQSINYNDQLKTCDLLESAIADSGNNATTSNGWIHYETDPTDQEVGNVCSSTSPCKGHYCEDICEPPGFKCTCQNNRYGERCELGSNLNPGKSCKWIKENYPTMKSGYYLVQLHKPTSVYCDMETLGGGWTKFGDVLEEKTPTDILEFVESDISLLDEVSTRRFLLDGAGFNDLYEILNFTQFRFMCRKQWHGRKIHIVTTDNDLGHSVIEYLRGKTVTQPDACGSYIRLADDTSVLSSDCSRWRRWGHHGNADKPLSRLKSHLFYVSHNKHVNLIGRRMECDDQMKREYNATHKYGEWRFYVR